ncbi:MAG: glycosyltransferase family 2 protein [Bacteroidales bacterium]|nr:glycosyltransferase family 2 protein [Bacteroidales bacterium]
MIAVVIPTFNRCLSLKEVLICLNQQKLSDLFITVVVVDGSSDGTLEMIKDSFPNVHVVIGDGTWYYTKSINEGIKYALNFNPSFILTLNDDIIFGDIYISTLLKAAYKQGHNSMIHSISITNNDPAMVKWAGVKNYIKWRMKSLHYIKPFTLYSEESLTGIKPTMLISGRGLLLPISAISKLGLFDELFPQYGSDEDYGLRAIKNGFSLFISWDAKVFENIKSTSKGAAFNEGSVYTFIKSFFNPYTVNYYMKFIRFYYRHGIKVLLPFLFVYYLFATTWAFFLKYKKVK